MSNRKRSRSVGEENRAECPFTISYATSPSAAQQECHKNKKRKRDGQDDDKRVQIQVSPFSPTGSFKTHDTMDLYYTVEPGKRWRDMTRYNSFVLNSVKYYSEGFVRVANEPTIEQQKAQGDRKGIYKTSNDGWVARILEVHASDEDHVYARVYWMYWPDELPAGTLDGKKTVQGRQPYHGANELIASNHMDIINVVSVTGPVTVKQWIESDDEEIQDALYWRQAYDCRNSQLSSVELICKCQTPANPDKILIGCTRSECGRWMHHECMAHDILMQVYERLGTDKPYRTKRSVVEEEKPKEATRPLSPTDAEEKETQPTNDNVHVKKAARETPCETETPTPGPTPSRSIATASAKKGRKKGRKKKIADSKPYLGLFEATLEMQDGPTAWEIRDLRENVTGGDKAWTEEAHCLLCGSSID
ncbi:hypothetical protein FOPG_19158 [Fusarium oxysporum f. sp. conglutinans race 2 54008]|uniref:BAH domain-containing protein n=3 Tax=Fusarium oxysporum f. sp. conglutinans TaxID=100902 RepID=A0A8H6H2E7_FUSOX|nr:hypothetical protein FOXB_11721 [Fusarium oxysporum f. sp. conglutinans Fo5176]EXL64586.1 hypothetical protein FOPG_19158 [Fusarium oxysporum f. sp. conglutinans race 2 54008]KAF6528474.1 hypothetical protein HZS61_008776 [Fusarium oxysporum f. sp. conglutinans]KAG6990547.1 Chromatin remodeling protein SHL [Fusarium oxysporum f. sp. conglutinans]KAI8416216.1 hypothetical protein FOFC_02525 [Fusarium oxysporum]